MNNDEMLLAIKDMFEKKTEEIKSYVDTKLNGQSVLIEKLSSDVKAVAEGYSSLDKRFESVEKDMKVVKEYVIGMDAKLNEHEVILKRVK